MTAAVGGRAGRGTIADASTIGRVGGEDRQRERGRDLCRLQHSRRTTQRASRSPTALNEQVIVAARPMHRPDVSLSISACWADAAAHPRGAPGGVDSSNHARESIDGRRSHTHSRAVPALSGRPLRDRSARRPSALRRARRPQVESDSMWKRTAGAGATRVSRETPSTHQSAIDDRRSPPGDRRVLIHRISAATRQRSPLRC